VPQDLVQAAQRLDKHYILTRYPNGFDTGAPLHYYTHEEGLQARADAQRMYHTGLQAGTVAPDQWPIQVIERGGVRSTLNNRSLMALRLAGMAPTSIRNVTGNPMFEAL